MTTNKKLAVISRAGHWTQGRLTRKGGHCEVLMGVVGVGVCGGRVSLLLLLLVMRIGDGEKKRRGACEVVVVKSNGCWSLGAMTLPGTDRGEVVAAAEAEPGRELAEAGWLAGKA
jgi:hypothetical protein